MYYWNAVIVGNTHSNGRYKTGKKEEYNFVYRILKLYKKYLADGSKPRSVHQWFLVILERSDKWNITGFCPEPGLFNIFITN